MCYLRWVFSVSVPFDLNGRNVLLSDKLHDKVHFMGVRHGMSCDAVVALIVERYFRLPVKDRELLEQVIYEEQRRAKRKGEQVKFDLTVHHSKRRNKKVVKTIPKEIV